jgi:hypothetical protein
MSINSDGKVEAKLMLVKQREKSTIVLLSKNSSLLDYQGKLLFQDNLQIPTKLLSYKDGQVKRKNIRKFYRAELQKLLKNEGAYRVLDFTELIKEGAHESLVNEAVTRIVTSALQNASMYIEPNNLKAVLLNGHENFETTAEIETRKEIARRRRKAGNKHRSSDATVAADQVRVYAYQRLKRLSDILEFILDETKEEAGILLEQVKKDTQDAYANTDNGRQRIKREEEFKKAVADLLPAARILAQLHPLK